MLPFSDPAPAGGEPGEAPAPERLILSIPLAEEGPLVPVAATPDVFPEPPSAGPAPAPGAGLPYPVVRELLRQISSLQLSSLRDLLPVLQVLALAVVAVLLLRITGATLSAIDEVPLVGGLLELVGVVSVLGFLARLALRQRNRAELLVRIRKLRKQLLG
ncbi:CAAD domain-containing protein [Cyanobium sp. ATX 6F1]|uniref:CAAD domain-containing protein n=1 Tax=Cyanobium sp. ATX 6F1 TaxID=2823702 RepID=UPI0020CEFC81|nr:CAAD domain-containing protein [Cyanobium sp. ATX 6F1]MCP9915624.1 CAAD domain-containing protein [Cyanobium sp. ATX 6F1]